MVEERAFGSYTSQNGVSVILTREAGNTARPKREARSSDDHNKNTRSPRPHAGFDWPISTKQASLSSVIPNRDDHTQGLIRVDSSHLTSLLSRFLSQLSTPTTYINSTHVNQLHRKLTFQPNSPPNTIKMTGGKSGGKASGSKNAQS